MEIGYYYPYFNRTQFGEALLFNSILVLELRPEDSFNGRNSYVFKRDAFVIRAEAPGTEYWAIAFDGWFWDICWNNWFIKMAKLPSSEIAIFRFLPCADFSLSVASTPNTVSRLRIYCEPKKLSSLTNRPMLWMCPWFNYLRKEWRPLYFVFTELIFVKLNHTESLHQDHTVSTSLGIIREDRKVYDDYFLDDVLLDPSRAILLSSNLGEKLYALPWKSEHLTKKSHVDRYCQKLFRWFENRCIDATYNKKCPAKVLFAEEPTQRILVESKLNNYEIFALGSTMDWHTNFDCFLDLRTFFGQSGILKN